jgi:hypothetical protein
MTEEQDKGRKKGPKREIKPVDTNILREIQATKELVRKLGGDV